MAGTWTALGTLLMRDLAWKNVMHVEEQLAKWYRERRVLGEPIRVNVVPSDVLKREKDRYDFTHQWAGKKMNVPDEIARDVEWLCRHGVVETYTFQISRCQDRRRCGQTR